ncbi:fructosamine kinase family protein [Arcticibacter sp. MXS-1]|uniref:fructosamine kinase family protein n=1 Tax=Arcticibacter sp. MXS-1 TaxID=3341726 RepID=UPI0035A8DF57
MYISEQTLALISQSLAAVGVHKKIEIVRSVGGGSINSCYQLKAGQTLFFAKINNAGHFPEMFFKESAGLREIAHTETIKVPKVLACGTSPGEQFLVLQWINAGRPDQTAMALMGEKLAAMHRTSSSGFGLDYDNYMGSLEQRNQRHPSWTEFFIEERLKPQIKIASDKKLIDRVITAKFERLFTALPGLFDEEDPSLLHGDLWAGNYMISETGEPVLIDPAVSYGHREFDIAMTTLFGGFDEAFYQAYHDAFPLQSGWQERLDIWNLYPLLVHVNLFGSSYLAPIRSTLERF